MVKITQAQKALSDVSGLMLALFSWSTLFWRLTNASNSVFGKMSSPGSAGRTSGGSVYTLIFVKVLPKERLTCLFLSTIILSHVIDWSHVGALLPSYIYVFMWLRNTSTADQTEVIWSSGQCSSSQWSRIHDWKCVIFSTDQIFTDWISMTDENHFWIMTVSIQLGLMT